MPVFRGVDLGREEPQAPPPEPLPPLPWEEVGQPRPPGGQAPYGPQPLPPGPAARTAARLNRQPWEAPAPRFDTARRLRRFLPSLGRALAGQVVDSRLLEQGLLGDWLRRVSEAPPGSLGTDPEQVALWNKAFSGLTSFGAYTLVPPQEEMQEFLRTPLGALGAIPPLAPIVRLPSNIGVGMSAAYGATRQARRALAAAPGIPSRARLPIAGLKGVRGATFEPPPLTPPLADSFREGLNARSVFEGGEVRPGLGVSWRSMGLAEYHRLTAGEAIGGGKPGTRGASWSWFPARAAAEKGGKGRPKYLVEVRVAPGDAENIVRPATLADVSGVWRSEGADWVRQPIPTRAIAPAAAAPGQAPLPAKALTPLEEQIVRTYAGKTSADFTIRKVGQGATAAWKTFDKAGTDLGGVPISMGGRSMAEGNLRRYIEFANENQPRFAPPGQAAWPIMQEARRMGFDRPAREGVLQNLRKAVLAGEGDAPVLAWTRREGDWFVEVSTAGWSPARLARYGLEPAPDVRLPFGEAYRLRDVTPLLEQPIITEAAGVRPPARWGGPPSRAPGMGGAGWRGPPGGPPPDVILPGEFYNWRPDPVTGQMLPPPPGLGRKVAEAFSQGDPTLSMNLHRLFVDKNLLLAELSSDPAINKFLRFVSREHWDIGRDPRVVTSAMSRQAASRLVTHAQYNAALPLDEALARLGYDRRTGVIKGVSLKPGARPAPPKVEGTFYDIRTRPNAYIMPEKLRLWLDEQEAFNRALFVVPEHQMGIKYSPIANYATAAYKPRPGPEGAKARELFQRLQDATGENPKLRLGRKQAFEYEKIFHDAPTAWDNGFELVPEARGFMGNTLRRSRASARAIGDAVGEQVAKELGGDAVVRSLRELLGESANPILRAAEAAHEATILPILGLDPFGVLAIQTPGPVFAEMLRLPADIARGRVPLPVLRHTTASLFPDFMSRYPLHGLGWLKLAIPRMHRPESHTVFARLHAETTAYLNSLGHDPFPGITGYVDDVGMSVPGKLREALRTPSKGQFATLGENGELTFEAMSRTMKKARAALSPEEMARFLDDAPLPPELVAKLKTSRSAFHDDFALADHLSYVFGGINAAKTSPRAITRLLEKGLLAPGWTRKKIGLLFAAGKLDRKGELAREFLIESLMAYVLVGEPISYALTGEGMNLTHPDRSDWMAIRIGKDKWVNPMTPITSPLRAVVAPIYRRIQTGKWNFREPVSWGAGQAAPMPRMGIELPRDQTLYGNRAITTLSENSMKSRFFYALRQEAPIAVQQFMDMRRTGTFGGVEAGLTAFSFNVVAPSQQQLLIREARVEAAIAAGVPTAQARELARYGANPIFAKDEEDKYVLSDQKRSAATASAFRYASRFDQSMTQDVYDSSGFPTADNRRRQDERMRDFADRDQAASERHWERVNFIAQQFEDTLAGKLTGDQALSPDGFRAAMRSETEAARKERWGIDAERNAYVRENNLQQWWKQRQDDGLDHKQREDVARQAFLFGAEDVTGQQQPGILSIELYDHATGRTRYKERDALIAKWEMLVGEDVVEEWLESWRTAEAHPLAQEYWDGQDRYEYYFETRDRVLQKASPTARQWFDARDKASDTRDRLRQNFIRRAWPAEAKAAEDRIEAEQEYLRVTIPGLDAFLLKFGYRDKPVTEE